MKRLATDSPFMELVTRFLNDTPPPAQIEAAVVAAYPDPDERAMAVENLLRWFKPDWTGREYPAYSVLQGLRGQLPPSWQPIQGDLDLTLIAPGLREMAVKDLSEGDVGGFLCRAENGNQFWLDILHANLGPLQQRGLYEAGLFEAYIGCRMNNSAWPTSDLRFFFKEADSARLRAAGESIPDGPWPRTVYRGVAGSGRRRRERGFSWTADLERARWFANRPLSLPDPAVVSTVILERDVLFYTNRREEQEYVVMPPRRIARLEAREALVEAEHEGVDDALASAALNARKKVRLAKKGR